MISLKDTSHIAATPSQVWGCFAEMDTHYLDWHPDHVVWRNLEGNATVPHGVIYADEKVGSCGCAASSTSAEPTRSATSTSRWASRSRS